MATIYQKLMTLQQEFKAGKTERNNFANFNYRNIETMLDKLKPLLQREGLVITFDEDLMCDSMVMNCTVTLIDVETGEKFSTRSSVKADTKYKGMSDAQASGASVSYLRKYALGGLLALGAEDKDFDSMPPLKNEPVPSPQYDPISQINMCHTIADLNAVWSTFTEQDKQNYKQFFTQRKNIIKNARNSMQQ